MQILNGLISAFFQVILVSIIPLVWWLVTARKEISFFSWIGLKVPVIRNKRKFAFVFVGALILFTVLSLFLIPLVSKSTELATSQFSGQGFAAIVPALIYAFLQTAFSEEIFFRGFLGKRFIRKFGFSIGNGIQATLFGLLHGAILIGSIGITKSIIVILFTGGIGWLMGYINEKESGGSILSSWCMHGIANTMAAITVMFSLI
ncbi:MAG: protease family protein [Acetobacterium sp.]|nr:protease family protein [Acetobacterium sp.]